MADVKLTDGKPTSFVINDVCESLLDDLQDEPQSNGFLLNHHFATLSDTLEASINHFYDYRDFDVCSASAVLFNGATVGMDGIIDGLRLQDAPLRLKAVHKLFYLSLGCFNKDQSTNQQLQDMQTNNSLIVGCGFLPIVYANIQRTSALFDAFAKLPNHKLLNAKLAVDANLLEFTLYLCIMFNVLVSHTSDELALVLDDLRPNLATYLLDVLGRIAEYNQANYPLKKLLMLIELVLRTIMGPDDHLAAFKNKQRLVFGLPSVDYNKDHLRCTPQDYLNQFVVLSHRYPSCVLPEPTSLTNNNIHLFGNLSESCRMQIQPFYNNPLKHDSSSHGSFPAQPVLYQSLYLSADSSVLPKPMVETLNTFQKHCYVSLGAMQVAHERARQSGSHTQDNSFTPSRYEKLYRSLVKKLPVYISMLVRLIYYLNLVSSVGLNSASESVVSSEQLHRMDRNAFFETRKRLDAIRHCEVSTAAIVQIIVTLLRASKAYHQLAFENVCHLLFANNYVVLMLKIFMMWFPNPTAAQTKAASVPWFDDRHEPVQLDFLSFCRGGHLFNRNASTNASTPTASFATNQRRILTTVHMLYILHKLTKGKRHEVLVLVHTRSFGLLKRLLSTRFPLVCLYALKILKSQIPYIGFKRRVIQSSMRVLSLIYLLVRPRLYAEFRDLEKTDKQEALEESQARLTLVDAFHKREFKDHHQPNTATGDSQSKCSTDPFVAGSKQRVPDGEESMDDLDLVLKLAADGTFDNSNPVHAALLNPRRRRGTITSHSIPHALSEHLHPTPSIVVSDTSSTSNEGDEGEDDGQEELDDNFMMNYEAWLKQEVYDVQNGTSSKSSSGEYDELLDDIYEDDERLLHLEAENWDVAEDE